MGKVADNSDASFVDNMKPEDVPEWQENEVVNSRWCAKKVVEAFEKVDASMVKRLRKLITDAHKNSLETLRLAKEMVQYSVILGRLKCYFLSRSQKIEILTGRGTLII